MADERIRSSCDVQQGDRVRHVSTGGGMGIGTVMRVDEFGIHVRFDKGGRLNTGIYDDEWFEQARAKLYRDSSPPTQGA